MPEKSSSNFDIFLLLSENEEKAKKKRKTGLLSSLKVEEFFQEGSISIDKRTCRGVECKLCINACPTNALYWKAGEVGIVDDLCVYCGACVLSCVVDDCIKIERKRKDGTMERFSKPKEVVKLEEKINAKNRFKRISELFPTAERYIEKYKRQG